LGLINFMMSVGLLIGYVVCIDQVL